MSNTHQTGWIRCVELHKSSVRAANINVKWSKLNWVHYRALSNRWKLFGAKKKKRKKRAREASGRKKSVVEIWMKSWWIRRRAREDVNVVDDCRTCVCVQLTDPSGARTREVGRNSHPNIVSIIDQSQANRPSATAWWSEVKEKNWLKKKREEKKCYKRRKCYKIS